MTIGNHKFWTFAVQHTELGAKEKVEDGKMLFENPDYDTTILGVSDEGSVCYFIDIPTKEYNPKDEYSIM